MSDLHLQKLLKFAVINDHLVSLIPDSYSSKKELLNWLDSSPYSPYVSLYGGVSSLTYQQDKSFISDIDQKIRYRLDDIFSFKFENFEVFGNCIYSANTRLSNILNCDELFRAYPEFRDIEVAINISNANNGVMSGANYYTEGRIEVFADSNESAMRVLLHELQHSIQVKEGFAIGESYYKEEGVMDLFVGSSVDVNGNFPYGSFSDMATKRNMVEISDNDIKILNNYEKHLEILSRFNDEFILFEFENLERGRISSFDYKKQLMAFYKRMENKNTIIHSHERQILDTTFEQKYPTTLVLEDLIKHNSLFEIYPQLKDLKVEFSDALSNGANGSLGFKNNTFSLLLNSTLKNSTTELKSTIVHEIQHAIQSIESWAKGGNIKEFKSALDENTLFIMKENLGQAIFLKELSEKFNLDIDSMSFREDTYASDVLKNKDAVRIAKNNPLEWMNKEYNNLSSSAFNTYQRLWGEQQARAVQNRVDMDLKERLGEDWTKTLERVEGKYDEPIIRYDSVSIQQSIELEQRYLKKDGWVDYEAIERDGLEKIPKYFTSYEKFEKMFKNKISSRKALIDTPIGNVKIDLMGAFKHLTNNTNGANRTKYSGALISIFEDPLFIVRDEYEGEPQNIFYKPMMSKNKDQGIVNLAGFALDKNGNLVNTTFFPIKEGKLVKYIQSKEEDLLYFKHAGAALKAVTPKVTDSDSGKTRASDEILSENSLNVNGFNKEQRDKNFKAWFGDSKVVDEHGEPLVVYHGTNQSFDKFRVSPTSWFTHSASHAEKYSSKEGVWWKKNSPNIMSVYLSIKNPYRLPSEFKNTTEREMILDMVKVDTIKLLGDEKLQILKSLIKESSVEKTNSSIIWNVSHKLKEAAQLLGFDGYMAREVDSHMNTSPNFYSTYSPFEPTQIKSIHNQGTFNSENPNILEKNDYGMRYIEKVLSIVPDNIKMDIVKNYLAFNGINQKDLLGDACYDSLKGDIFLQPLRTAKSLDINSSYFSAKGEVEAREIEDLYIHENKIDEMSLAEIAGRFNKEEHGELTTLLGRQSEERYYVAK